MGTLFMSYRGTDRSRVKETISDLKSFGLGHTILHDLDAGDNRKKGSDYVYSRIVKPILKECEGLILIIGDTTANPKQTLESELNYAKSNQWDVFGILLTNRTGGPPPELKKYKYYFELEYEPSEIVSFITRRIPND